MTSYLFHCRVLLPCIVLLSGVAADTAWAQSGTRGGTSSPGPSSDSSDAMGSGTRNAFSSPAPQSVTPRSAPASPQFGPPQSSSPSMSRSVASPAARPSVGPQPSSSATAPACNSSMPSSGFVAGRPTISMPDRTVLRASSSFGTSARQQVLRPAVRLPQSQVAPGGRSFMAPVQSFRPAVPMTQRRAFPLPQSSRVPVRTFRPPITRYRGF